MVIVVSPDDTPPESILASYERREFERVSFAEVRAADWDLSGYAKSPKVKATNSAI